MERLYEFCEEHLEEPVAVYDAAGTQTLSAGMLGKNALRMLDANLAAAVEHKNVLICGGNKAFQAYINKPVYSPANGIFEKSYWLYQMQWFATHCSFRNLNDAADEWRFNNDPTSLSEYIEEHGFGGSLWVCKEEFGQSEYRDYFYMRDLLNEEDFLKYLSDVCKTETSNLESKGGNS